MDPNATLEQIRDLVAEFQNDESWDSSLDAIAAGHELAMLVESLDEWASNGGFLPLEWGKW